MSVITSFYGAFCREEVIIAKLLQSTGYKPITDSDTAARASEVSGIAAAKVSGVFSSKTSIFNKFTHEKERSLAYMRLAAAEMLSNEKIFFSGNVSHLIPKDISHILRICLIADMKSRIDTACSAQGISEKEAADLIRKSDQEAASWTHSLFKTEDPWDPSLYDIVIPTDKMTDDDIVKLVQDNLTLEVIQSTEGSRKAAEDFLLAANVEVALAKEGHHVEVKARDGYISLVINQNVLMLSRLEKELKEIAEKVQGVKEVETRVGKRFYQADIYRKYDFQVPSKVLLVDDEREFVQTLSERLQMRDMGSAIAYDGESALNLVKEEEPEVMILDLKMPGIDGIEVLKKVKESNPEIEVIILTGHGSEANRETCMQLGAFAYLHKPVDIELLSKTLKAANEKIQSKRINAERVK